VTGFKTLPGSTTVHLAIDGHPAEAPAGASVAAALLLAGHRAFGPHPVDGAPEGPWCLIGVCFGCLVTIDGVKDRQACLVPVSDGMTVRTRLDQR
jgi:predicted molibdopterin-dependent oxidoreductase YjgC